MSWSYSEDPSSSDLDAVRFYVQDTIEADPLISDEEILFLLDAWLEIYNGSTLGVASVAAGTIAAKFSREVSYSADGVSVGVNELQQKYAELAASLRSQYDASSVGGGPIVTGVDWNEPALTGVKPSIFATGMHDNVRAGAQDYGSDTPADTPEITGF